MTISEEAVKAAAEKIREVTGTYAEVAHAALTAAAPHLAAVRVKKLGWSKHPEGAHESAEEVFGGLYLATDEGWRRIQGEWNSLSGLAAAKAAAQADFEARILSALEPSALDMGNPITLTYTNYRGETSERAITPIRPWFGSTEWHPEPQWLLRAYDHDKGAERDFALKDFGRQQPSAARELALEEGDLNARLKAKGMYSIDEMMGSLPLDKWRVHSGMTDLKFFGEWLERKTRDYCTMRAAYEVGDKDESDELYEWVLAHYGAFHDVLVNFRAALSSPDHADAGKVEGDARADLERFWRPISEADRTITYEDTFNLGDGKSMTIRNSDHFWVRDADGRVYEATWSDHKGGYWWDLEGESRVDPVEYMPHPLSLPSAPSEGDSHGE